MTNQKGFDWSISGLVTVSCDTWIGNSQKPRTFSFCQFTPFEVIVELNASSKLQSFVFGTDEIITSRLGKPKTGAHLSCCISVFSFQ